ncbi:MAG: hypothetical protein AAF806_19510, partial [Bacteroidota bacterium]
TPKRKIFTPKKFSFLGFFWTYMSFNLNLFFLKSFKIQPHICPEEPQKGKFLRSKNFPFWD